MNARRKRQEKAKLENLFNEQRMRVLRVAMSGMTQNNMVLRLVTIGPHLSRLEERRENAVRRLDGLPPIYTWQHPWFYKGVSEDDIANLVGRMYDRSKDSR